MNGRDRKLNIVGLLAGAAFGFLLAAGDLHDFDTIHNTLKLAEFDVFLLMGAAIGTSLPLLWWLDRRRTRTLYGGPLALSRSKPERHHVVGGALFGAGWALAGTCPAPALVMTSSGASLGLVVMAGLFLGLHVRDRQVAAASVAVSEGDGERSLVPAGTSRP